MGPRFFTPMGDGEAGERIYHELRRRPFIVYRRHLTEPDRQACEVLGCNAYSVSEFTS